RLRQGVSSARAARAATDATYPGGRIAMCGVAGFILPGQPRDAGQRLKAMTDRIRHRGPDGEGFFLQSSADGRYTIGLGHRRLAIIDLATGDQPITHQSAGVTLVFNGEIYNFRELRAALEAKGHRFRTTSDTEVLLNAYVEWGPRCVERFRGMFAFALWDDKRQRLVLARDHFGKKPFFILESGGKVLFGSEIKAILSFGDATPSLDRASLADYFVYRYVPAPNTLFAGIRKLMPGSYAVWEKGHLTETAFYRPPYGEAPDLASIADPVTAFTERLDEAVRVRMVSDVPFGAFLSGGLDSSAIVALMSRHSAQPINTFSVGFREARYSELPYAATIARQFDTNHTELTIAADDLMQHLPTLIEHGDAPVADPSNIPLYLISRAAANSVKMVLTGEGSDELLAGYPKHSAERFVALYQRMVSATLHRRLVEPLMRLLPYEFRRVKIMAAAIGLRDPQERLPRWLGALSFAERDRLLDETVPRRAVDARPFEASPRRSALERALYFDQTSWLPDNLLERGDRISMAASIEARMPFMDTELAELVARLPDSWRIRGLVQKYILRSAMAETLPPVILDRPKVGFRVPVNEWFRGPMRAFIRDHISGQRSLCRELCDGRQIEQVLREHESGRQNHEKLLWTLVNLELFQERYALAPMVTRLADHRPHLAGRAAAAQPYPRTSKVGH
ncbi:MAG: asparagine synthase (glutamine-hydrolyzing), partial [Candidatus Acidiferrales bacterium]